MFFKISHILLYKIKIKIIKFPRAPLWHYSLLRLECRYCCLNEISYLAKKDKHIGCCGFDASHVILTMPLNGLKCKMANKQLY